MEIRKGGRVRRLLFDTGVTPSGCADNLHRLDKDPADIEVIVCSHGHFDHTTGLSGLIGQLGRANVPVLMDAISCWFSESTVQELFRTRM